MCYVLCHYNFTALKKPKITCWRHTLQLHLQFFDKCRVAFQQVLSQSLTFLVRFKYIEHYYFRGDYFCAPKQFGKFQSSQLDFGITYFGREPPVQFFNVPRVPSYRNQAFPGYFDRGSPLIIEEEGQQTVIGLSKEQENSNRDRPNIFHKIHPDAFRWIVKHAEAHDSNCESFTSCSCGIPGKPLSTSSGRPTHPHQELRR